MYGKSCCTNSAPPPPEKFCVTFGFPPRLSITQIEFGAFLAAQRPRFLRASDPGKSPNSKEKLREISLKFPIRFSFLLLSSFLSFPLFRFSFPFIVSFSIFARLTSCAFSFGRGGCCWLNGDCAPREKHPYVGLLRVPGTFPRPVPHSPRDVLRWIGDSGEKFLLFRSLLSLCLHISQCVPFPFILSMPDSLHFRFSRSRQNQPFSGAKEREDGRRQTSCLFLDQDPGHR